MQKQIDQVKLHVKIAYDVKKNLLLTVLQDFEKRFLRLNIVQYHKRTTPHGLMQMDGVNGGR